MHSSSHINKTKRAQVLKNRRTVLYVTLTESRKVVGDEVHLCESGLQGHMSLCPAL